MCNFDPKIFFPVNSTKNKKFWVNLTKIKVDYNKKKNKNLHFQIIKTLKPDVYELYLKGANNIVKNGIACVPNFKTSEFLNSLFTDPNKEYYVECSLNEKFKKWQPLKASTFMSQADEL